MNDRAKALHMDFDIGPGGKGYRQDPGCCSKCCVELIRFFSLVLVILTLPISVCFCVKIVKEYERAVIFRLGRVLRGARGPGMFFIIPCIDTFVKVDIRTVTFDVPPQEILTKDSVAVTVDAVVYWKINNPLVAVTNVENYSRSTQLLAQTTLRNQLGTRTLSEILAEREAVSDLMQVILDDGTDPWGVKVERVEIKDVSLPVQLQRVMAAEAEADREARAKVITATGEKNASYALQRAAQVIDGSPVALQLRFLQTLMSVSAEKNSTIIYPMPLNLMPDFHKRRGGQAAGL